LPRREPIDPDAPAREAIARAGEVLRGSGVVAYPTETFYALGARAADPAACERIFLLKGREEGKPLPLIAADLEQVLLVAAELPDCLSRLAARFWPGPLTLVLRAGLPGWTSLAVRVSSCPAARELARAAGGPITATSANRSGQPPARTADQVEAAFAACAPPLDLILDGGATPGGLPSTIVDLTGGEPRLLRAGPIDFQQVVRELERGAAAER
jgi:L-threonylcarbamoyladenylate synthase